MLPVTAGARAVGSNFVMPQQAQAAPLKVTTRALRNPEAWRLHGTDTMSREVLEQKVYDAMFDGAFDQLDKKLNDVLL